MTPTFRSLVAAVSVAAALAGCGVQAVPGAMKAEGLFGARSTGAPWSLMTFFALDNDLDNGTGIVNRLHGASGPAKNVTAVSFYDGSRQNDTIYVADKDGVQAQAQKMAEADSGTGAALDAFVKFAVGQAPAPRKVLSMADHGGGIVRGICSDWNGPGGKKIIHMNEVGAVLAKQPVEVMMFDACFMQMVEVAYEIKDGAKVLVAAQTTTRGDFPYAEIVRVLDAHPKADSREVGARLLDAVYANARYEVALGAFDVTKVDTVATRMNKLSGVLMEKIKNPATKKAVAQALRQSQAYAAETNPGMQMYNNYRDMVDVMAQLARLGDPEITAAAKAVAEATQAAIIGEKHRNGRELNLDKASGIALYAQVDGPVEYKYMGRAWNKDTRWGDFLSQLNTGSGWGPSVAPDRYPYSFPSRKK